MLIKNSMESHREFIKSEVNYLELENNLECIEEVNSNLIMKKPDVYKEVHFLPCRFEFDGVSQVKEFFSTQIKENKNDLSIGSNQYTSSFRGKLFNGKKIELNDNLKCNYIEVKQQGNESMKLEKINNIDHYFYWRFDEEIMESHVLGNLRNFADKLSVLK